MKSKRARATGVLVTVEEPTGVLAEEAKKVLKDRWVKACVKTEKAKENPKLPPNYICYPEAFKDYDPATGRWKGGSRRLPKCRVCECTLHPNENHVCSGFTPKYKEHDKESHERFEARREMIRESRPRTYDYDGEPIVMCDVCGERMEDPEAGQWHWEDHEGKPEDTRHTRDGEPDGDLDGYDDEPEDDYCEGDDDGWDCD